jgi:isoleucyl-tRNA synthetase
LRFSRFATLDLSAFYFDIRKGCAVCDGDTERRRAALTVLDHLYARLTTWLAPILTFTMEEVWLERSRPDTSVHLVDFRTRRMRGATMNWRRGLKPCVHCAVW